MTDERRAVIREELAEYAHEAWSGWMTYMWQIAEANGGPFGDWESYLQRWKRQAHTSYADLPEHEKHSDRAEADRMLAIIEAERT